MANIRVASVRVVRGLVAVAAATGITTSVIASGISVASAVVTETPQARVSMQAAATTTLVATPVYVGRLAVGISILPLRALAGEVVRASDATAFSIETVFIDVATATEDLAIVMARVAVDQTEADDVVSAFDASKQATDTITLLDPLAVIFDRQNAVDTTTIADSAVPVVALVQIDAVDSIDGIDAFAAQKVLQDAVVVLETVSAFNVDQVLDTTSTTDSDPVLAPDKQLTDNVATVDSDIKEPRKNVEDTTSAAEQINTINVLKVSADVVTLIDPDSKTLTRPDVSDAVDAADADAKTASAPHADSVAASDTIEALSVGQVSVEFVFSAELINAFAVSRALEDATSIADAPAKQITRPDLVDSAAMADNATVSAGVFVAHTVVAVDPTPITAVGKASADETVISDALVATLTTGGLAGRVNTAMINEVMINGGS